MAMIPHRKQEVPPEIAYELNQAQDDIDTSVVYRQNLVREALKEGASKNQIAKVLGINPHQVNTILNPKRRQV